jgi:hypothetical protein
MITQQVFANVPAATTDSVLLAAVPGRRIKVLSAVIQGGGTATTITFNSKGTGAGTAISATFALGINGNLPIPVGPSSWFDTVAGQALTCTTGAGATVGVQLIVGLE